MQGNNMSGGIVVGGSAKFSCSRGNYNFIYNDIVFFFQESARFKEDEPIRKRYARTSIVFTAFLVEAIANLFYEEYGTLGIKKTEKELREKYKHRRLSFPLLKLIEAYYDLCKKELSLDVDGIRDLFKIRNEIIAHPKSRSIVSGTGVKDGIGLTHEHEHIRYYKFKEFPNIYSEFGIMHAEKLFKETQAFLSQYHELVENKIPQQWLLDIFKINSIDI